MQYLQIWPDGEIMEKNETRTKHTNWGMETNGIRQRWVVPRGSRYNQSVGKGLAQRNNVHTTWLAMLHMYSAGRGNVEIAHHDRH